MTLDAAYFAKQSLGEAVYLLQRAMTPAQQKKAINHILDVYDQLEEKAPKHLALVPKESK